MEIGRTADATRTGAVGSTAEKVVLPIIVIAGGVAIVGEGLLRGDTSPASLVLEGTGILCAMGGALTAVETLLRD